MHSFPHQAIKLIYEYKGIIRKQQSEEEASKKLIDLGLNQKLPKKEIKLYHIIHQILNYERNAEDNKSSPRYSGLNRFLNDLDEFISSYHLDGDEVIHPGRAASRAFIEAVQIMALDLHRFNTAIHHKLDNCARLIAKYGETSQRHTFLASLKAQVHRCESFIPLLHKYHGHLSYEETVEEDEAMAC